MSVRTARSASNSESHGPTLIHAASALQAAFGTILALCGPGHMPDAKPDSCAGMPLRGMPAVLQHTSTAEAAAVLSVCRSPLCPPLNCQHPLITLLTSSCGDKATLGTTGSDRSASAGLPAAAAALSTGEVPASTAAVPASSCLLLLQAVVVVLLGAAVGGIDSLPLAQQCFRFAVKGVFDGMKLPLDTSDA